MKAIRVHSPQAGGDGLVLEDVPYRTPPRTMSSSRSTRPGSHRASRAGRGPGPTGLAATAPRPSPAVPGHEVSGEVAGLGLGTTGLTFGRRFFGLTGWTRDVAAIAAEVDGTRRQPGRAARQGRDATRLERPDTGQARGRPMKGKEFGLDQDEHGVRVHCRTGDRVVTLTGSYALACPGARGEDVRRMIGLTFEGHTPVRAPLAVHGLADFLAAVRHRHPCRDRPRAPWDLPDRATRPNHPLRPRHIRLHDLLPGTGVEVGRRGDRAASRARQRRRTGSPSAIQMDGDDHSASEPARRRRGSLIEPCWGGDEPLPLPGGPPEPSLKTVPR